LLQGLVVEDGVEAEGSVPEGLGDVCCAVVSEDIEGEASGAGHDAGVVADTAAIFVTGYVTDVVLSVFDAPMTSDDITPCGCREAGCGGDVVGDLTALVPQAGGGPAQPCVAGDADDGFDEGAPLGLGQGFADGKDFDGAMLLSRAAFVARRGGIDRVLGSDDGFDGVGEIGLIILELDQQMVARGQGGGECFFGRAWRRG
jgi:hypothetical protein